MKETTMNTFLRALLSTPKRAFNAAKRAPKRTATITMIAAAVIIPAALLAWGPVRQTFTMENPAPYPTFNSITDNPTVGDERNFVRIRPDDATSNFGDTVALTPGKNYQVMVYYHNDAASNLNDSGVGIAKNVTARVQMPASVAGGSSATITGFINSSNANPTSVWDEATASSSSAVALRYVQGSAKIASSNGAVKGAALPDSLFTTGTNLGYNALDGTLPGCLQYSGYITFDFTVDQPNFTAVKQVSVDGGKTWSTSAQTTPGSTILYRIIYTNTGTTEMDNVIDKDTLPAGVTYVPGSSLYASANTGGSYKAIPDGVTTGGFNTGAFLPTANSYLKFSAKVADNDQLPVCGTNTLHNVATVYNSDNGAKSASADVTVNRTCVTPPPAYVCTALTSLLVSGTQYEFNGSASASNGATIVNYVINFGDGTSQTVTNPTNILHTYSTTGATYSPSLTVNVKVDGMTKPVTSTGCTTSLTIGTPPVIPPVTPPELPHTGPTESIATFLGLGALIASVVYYVRSRRAIV